ncbi:MAG: hypothetical protein ACRDNZ_01375 [Streptosporangiaceae bacterium]
MIRRSGQTPRRGIAAIMDTYLTDQDCAALPAEFGLSDERSPRRDAGG